MKRASCRRCCRNLAPTSSTSVRIPCLFRCLKSTLAHTKFSRLDHHVEISLPKHQGNGGRGTNSLTCVAGVQIWVLFADICHVVYAGATDIIDTEPAFGGGSGNTERPNNPAQTRRDPECCVASDRGATLFKKMTLQGVVREDEGGGCSTRYHQINVLCVAPSARQ